MATNNDDIRWLYGKLKAKGYNIGSEQEFSSSLANEEDRKWYYDKAKGMGLNMGSMDDFNALYAPVSAQAPSPATEQPQMAEAEPQSAPTATAPVQEQASAPVAQSTPEQPTEPTWQPTEQERIRMQYNMFNMLNDFNQRSKERMERVSRMSEPYSEEGRQRRKAKEFEARMAGVNTKVLGITPPMSQPQGEVQTDTESAAQPQESPRMTQSPVPYGVKYVDGKPVAQWLLPDGSLTTNYLEADQAEYVARTNRQALANNSIDARIKRAESELEGLRQQLNESAARVHNEWAEDYEKNDAPLAAVLAANTYTPRQQSDRENSALRVAIRQKEELLKDLQEERDRQQGKDVGFWRGFGRAMTDFRTWDFGISDLSDAMTMMNAEHYSSPNATEGERKAGREMLKAIYDKQQAEQMYGENVSFWNRAGAMTGEMLPFMVDFALSGGGFEALNVAGKEAARASAKLIGKEALKKISELGVKGYAKKYGVRGVGRMAGNWTIKALGTTADDLLIRAPLMTNTVQGGKTAADIIDRKLGDVVVDENGNYDFTNDKTWGSAVWQGEANAIIENYSEMFGAHLDGVGTAIAEYAKTFGGKRISGMLARVNASGFGRVLETTRKQFQRLGVSDYFGEVAEEYYGQLWRTALNLDDAYTNVPVLDEQGNQVFDEQGNPVYELKNLLYTGQFHGDIWGGMALSMGLMGAGKYTLSGVGYANMKRNVNEADRVASAVFANVDWESLKEAIDNTTNEDMGSLAERIVKDSSLSDEERSAAMVYMERSLNLRGLDLAILAQSRGSEAENGPVTLDDVYSEEEENLTPEQIEARQIHEQGREVYSRFEDGDVAAQADADAIALRMQEAKQGVEDVFGEEDDYYMRLIDRYPWMLVNDPVLTAEQQDAVLYYINAKAALDGVMDASNEATDRKRAEVEHSVGKRTHKDYYVIIPATMKVNDRQVYIVKGDVVMFEDGTAVDVRNSSESVVVMDAATGEYEFTSPDQIFKVSDALNPQDELDVALSVIEQEQMNIFGQNAVAPEEPMVEAQSVPETPESVLNPTENAVAEGEIDAEVDANEESGQQTALSRIPTNEQGEPQFEQAENPEIGWDALVEFSEGDAGTAKEIADAMVEEKRKAYEKAQKQKPKGKTPTEILASKKAIASELAQAEQEYNLWQQMANVEQRRQNAIRSQEEAEARQRAAERAEAEKAEREAREEAERIQREALEGVPEWHMDTPDNARKRGARRFGGEMIVRQEPLQGVVGDEVEVKFSDRDMPKGRAVVIEASQLQPSHIQGSRNPMFFIDEAQPKNRAEEVSMMSAQEIAKGIRPKEITGNATAYTGAPTVNARGEVIQGNNRSDALRYLWGNNLPEQQREYKQYLLDNAEQFGIDRDAVSAMQNPVLVNMLDVEDAEAIRLGQMTSQDTESGGEERIKPQNVALKLGDEMRTFANRLLRTSDEDASFGQLVDRNGAEVLKWMNQIGAISNTQYKSAFDTKGNLTAEAKNDLQKVLYQAVFKGGSKQLEEMFEKLPAKAQRAILSTAFRDMDSPIAGQMLPEIQASVVAYHELMKDDSFANAKKIEDVLRAVDVFKRTTAFDDRLEQYMPADNFSNFALHLAAMYKANDMSQSTIASYFNQMFDLAQGEKAATLFEEADTTQYPLAEIVKQVLNIDYQPAKNGNNNVANGGADVALRNQNGQRGELRGNESPASGGQTSSGAESSERGEGAEDDNNRRNSLGVIGDRSIADFFGPVYTEFRGKGAEAEAYLCEACEGVAKGALIYPGIAPIDLAWGDKKAGYMKIVIKHPEVVGRLQELLNQCTISNQSDNRIVLESDTHKFIVSKMKGAVSTDNWLLTAYEKKEKSASASSSDIETEPEGKRNGTATPQNGLSRSNLHTAASKPHGLTSERKFSDSVSEKQEKNEESSLQLPDYNENLAVQAAVEAAFGDGDAEPTEAQKAAGNYKMEHRRVDGYNISIENTKGSVRRGIGADGKPWETAMQNDYGYIRGTEGVDGDHIDVFLSDTPEKGDVYVVDQVNEDGSFDEHKVMYGFPSEDAAREAYLSNYEPGWTGLGTITHVSKEEFKKWIGSSKRKTKPFAEYKSVKPVLYDNQGNPVDENGNLVIEAVKSVTDITDADFNAPSRTIGLPALPGIVQQVLSTNGKRVIIKKNIFERNALRHDELTPTMSRAILSEALYNSTLYGKNKPLTRPNNWIIINVPDGKGNNKLVVLEVNENKDNIEIVHWHEVDKRGLEKIKRQAEREDGQLLILPSETSEEAGALSGPTVDSPTDGKVNTLSADKQADGAESSEAYTITSTTYTNKKGKTSDVHLVKFNRELTTEEKGALDSFVREPLAEGKKTSRGWYDRKEGGYMMRSEEAARQLGEMIGNEEAIADAQPMTADELREAVGASRTRNTKPKKAPINRVNVEELMTDLSTKGETTLSEHAEPVKEEPKVEHEVSDEEMNSLLQELRDLLGIGDDEGDVNFKFREPSELTAQERQQIQSAGIRVAMGLLSRGTTLFPDYATKMVVLLGDKIRPWLKSFYEGARWTPGYEKYEFTPSEQVATFDVQNFDKQHGDPIAQAAMIVEERKASAVSQQAQKELTEIRNKTRKDNDKQREADTRALAAKAEAVASKAESVAKTSTDERELNRASEEIDRTLDEVNDQLALLGYYEFDEDDSKFHERYGYMLTAEKKAVQDATKLAKQLVNDLGIDLKVTSATTPLGRKNVKKGTAVRANLAPAGGDVTITLPLNEGRELKLYIRLDPVATRDALRGGDNLKVESIMYRVEWPDETGRVSFDRMGGNCWAKANTTYADLLKAIQREAREYIPKQPATESKEDTWKRMVEMAESGKSPYTVTEEVEQELAEQRKAQSEYKPGDEVEYSADGKKWEKAKVVEIDNDGVPVLDTGMAPVLYVRGNEGQIRRPKETIFEEAARVAKEAQDKKKENPVEKGWTSKPTSILSTNGNGAKVTIPIRLAKSNLEKVAEEFENVTNPKGFISLISQALGSPTGMRQQSFYYELMHGDNSLLTLRLSNHNVNADNHKGKTPEISIVIKSRRMPNRFYPSDMAVVTEYVYFKEDIAKGDGKILSSIAKDISNLLENGLYSDTSGIAIINRSYDSGVALRRKTAEVKPEQPIGDLFGGLFDVSRENDKLEASKTVSNEKRTDVQPRTGTAERERGHEPRQNESLGASQRNDAKGTDGRGMGGRDIVNPMSDGGRGGSVSRQPKSQSVLERLPESDRKNVRNNHAERGVDYAPKGEDARIKANIEAIELAKRLLEAGETATPEQMGILRKFSGWGGLGKAFNETGYTPNPTAKRLRELLGEQGYQDAVDSRRSAYYTPANVIDAMWDVVRAMGFKGGNVLEGSAGIGNIIGLMPTDMSERSSIHAVEIDSTTGGILSLLYPDAKVEIQGFEKTKVPNGSVDLAITNVPFITGAKVFDETGDKDLSKKFRDIHDFCIAKNVRKLREGGIGIFITSSGTMDNSKELRRWIINEGNADVVGAFRMHNKTFGGTGATSDIIVVRKRVNGKPSPNAIDVTDVTGVRVADYDTGKTRKVKGKETPVINQLSMVYNKYFAEHPENMAGEMMFNFERGETRFPTSRALFPVDGKDQTSMLANWANSFSEMKEEAMAASKVDNEVNRINERLGEGVKEGSIVVNSQGELCMARKGEAVPLGLNKNKVKGHTKAECFEAYSAIKKALSAVLEYQSNHESDEGLTPLLKELNRAFDTFTKTYGNLHKNTAISFLRNDVDFSSILALETYSEKGDKKGNKVITVGKTDIFSRRVIETEKEPQPTTIKDGILASLYKNGGVDVEYIGQALGKSTEEVKREIVESGLGFEDPSTGKMEVSYKYLSGNVREKLHIAQENNEDGKYEANIKALERVMPMNVPAHLIEFTLGSSWIEPKLYEDFVSEKTGIRVKLTNVGGTWYMRTPWSTFNEKNRAMAVISEKCDKTIMGHELIEAAITNRQITVSKTVKRYDGTTETITDKSATAECGTKVDEIRAEFKDWAREHMQADAEMSARIEQTYNEQFNNYVPLTIPDEFVPQHFGGQVSELHGKPFALRPHQGRAVVRGTTEPILLAHEVGTGKTYTLITTAMEMRRLGTARKPMIVVQNATVGQFVASAKEIYPNAKVLTIEDCDRTAEGRKNFYAKIKYNDWDMIVVPQSVLELIPDSPEREMAYVKDIIEEKMKVLETMREADSEGKSMIVRQAERELAEQENRLAELTEAMQGRKKKRDEKREATTRHNAEVRALEMLDREVDDVEDFDDMGIDAILVDEAHEYKHLGFATAMGRGVKGVDSSFSKKSQGVYLKVQSVMERNNGRNVVFATGTPISNTAAEIWTFMRYLMPADTMKSYGIYYFDDFVRNFGNIAQMVEFGTNGKFKENNRFAGYVNLPELVRIWSSVADTVLTREAGGVSDKIPDMEGGKPQDLYLPQTRALRSVMKHVKSELEKFEQMSGREKKENSHIPLTMYGIAKAAAIDVRLVMTNAEDDPNNKTNATVRETLRSLKDSAKYKGTVAIFSDNYQNKHSGFNLYEDIRKKLIAEGVPADQIVIIKSGMTIKKKLDIFEKVNAGEIRVIMGSTFTLGTGVNIQERLHTLIHVDAPNRPMDYTQRNGRALRQGNMHKDMNIPVRIIRFGVEDSLDVTAYQRLKTKGAIADSIMNGSKLMQNSMENRVLEEEEDTFGDMTAQLSGSEYAILKNQAEREVRSLTAKQKGHDIDQIYIHNQLPKVEGFIRGAEQRIVLETKNLEVIGKHFPDGSIKKITVGKRTFDNVGSMEEFFKEQNAKMNEAAEAIREGAENYTSKLVLDVDGLKFEVTTTVDRSVDNKGQGTLTFEPERKVTYSCEELGIKDEAVKGNRLKNVMQYIADEIATGKSSRELLSRGEQQLEHYTEEKRQLDARKGAEFPFKQQLEEAKARLAKYEDAMKEELAEKEAKYAEMDKDVEEATDVSYTEEDDEETATNGDGNKYRLVEDRETIDFLDNQPMKSGYRYSQWANHGVLPPMTAKKDGEWRAPMVFDRWEQSEEGMRKANGKADLVQGNGRTTGDVAYNPYFHIRTSPLNDQFTAAYDRPELLVIEGYYPESEETSGYRADGAKDSVGLMDWHSGSVNGQLSDDTKVQTMLSRYFKPRRIVPWSEVADLIMERVGDQQITFPINAVPPMLRAELARRGAKFGSISGSVSEKDIPMLEDLRDRVNRGEWDAGLEKAQAYQDAYDSSAEAKESRVLSLSDKLNTPVKLIRTQEEIDALPNRRQRRAKGWWSENDNSIVIVVPNNVNVADIENTFVHEVVGHKGLRALIGAERFDEFVGEVYDHASVPIRKEIDKATNAMVEAEADRLRVRMAQEHEQAGEDVNSHYYTDMAKARVEAEKKREQYRKEATEEYMADMAGKIGNEGFEKMNREEQTLWGKIKAKVQQFLDKFLQGLKIAKSIKLTDKDLAYILFKSWKNMRGDKGVFAQAEDAVMRYRTGWDKSMESRTAIVEETNKRFNEELQQQIDGTLPEGHVYQLGTPSEVLLSTGVPNLPIQLSAQRLKVKATEYGHDFDFDEIHNLVKELQNPMAVFVYGNKGKMQNIIVGIESNGNQFIVGLSLNPIVQGRALEINSVRNVFPKKNAEWLNWISQGKLLYADKQKIQALIDKQRTILADVEYLDLEDVAKIVENFENPTLEDDKIIRYRDGDDIIAKTPVLARGLYEQRVASTSYQVREALQDSMLGLKEAYLAIEKASGRKQHIEDIAGFENAYLSENRMSSKNHAEQGAFEKLVIKPMLDEVARLAPSESKYAELTEYMMAKHGLERNALMRSNAVADGMDQKAADATDFAGLTGLFATSDVADAEDMARTCVSDYESAHNTDELWNKVNAATKATLSKLKECGLLSAATHDKIANMYDNYIPLRGWAETTADEVYGYLSRNDGNLRGSVLKKAEGRKSVADDPIATIALMGEQAIAQANRNEMKQKFFNYVRRNPSDLVSVNRLWLQRNDVTDEWEPVFASNIKDDDDAATVQQKIDAFEQKMEAMSAAEPDKYKRGRQARGIPYKLGSGAVNEHTMLVKCGDDTYVMTINGNPRAAQALNGLTNPDVGTGVGAALFGLGEKINHAIAPIYTTRNPDFMVSNFLRDALYTNTMTWVKESPRYAARFNANFLRVNPIRMARLVSRYNNNTLDMNDPIERKFHEFIMEGGETGYTNQRDIEKHKKAVKKMLKRANGRISFGKVMDVLAEKWDVLNSAAENCARFAAYLTSLEEGRSIERAIYDAKEISVNFNKKGSGATFMGATGQTKAGNSAAFTSGTGRGLFVFWNAVVQASTNFMRNAERHPFKMAGVLVVPMFLLGAVQAMLGAFDDGDDDDDENNDGRHDYFNQPDYVRRSNILLRVGDQYLAHPLPHEYLAVFGLGEMAATLMMGKEEMSAGEISVEIAKMLSEFSPIPVDRAGWDHALMPSSVKPLYEASINESWTGMPIYKSNPYNENMPEWTKAYSSANHQLVNLAETINRNTGGDAYTKGDIDFNPAQVEYVLNGYFGGYFKIADRMIKMYETATGEREFEWRNMPLANRVVKQGDERTAMRSVNNSFFEYQNEYERIRDRIRSYEKEADNGIFEYAAKLAELSRTPEFHRYWILDGYQSDIRAIDKDLKEATTEAEIEESEKERDKLRAEIVGKLNGTTTIEPADTTGLGKERSYYERQAMQQ